jgi:formyl-CoA transferase
VEWEAHLGERVPCAAARPVEDMFEHPQVAAEGILAEFEHGRVGRYRGMAHPVHFPGGPAPAPFTAPELGQHSRAILAGLGYAPEEIERLCREGAVIG